MKKKYYISFFLFSILLLGFNISRKDSNLQTDNYGIENVKILQASAGEYNCDKSNQNLCETRGGKSSGVLTYYE